MGERTIKLGLVGVSGALGTEILALLREERFPLEDAKLFGAGGSAGDVHELGGTQHVVRRFDAAAVEELDAVVLATPAEISRGLAAEILGAGVYVIDASDAARDDPDVPVAVPVVDRGVLEQATGYVGVPGAFSVATAHVLACLPEGCTPRAIEATGLASAAALGRKGMAELSRQVLAVMGGRAFDTEAYPRQMAFDVVPWVGARATDDANPVSSEERRIQVELGRLFPSLGDEVSVTLAQTPVFCGSCLSLRVTFDAPCPLDQVVAAFETTPLVDLHPGSGPEQVASVLDAVERGEVLVSRVRASDDERTLRLWLSFDNLRLSARNIVLTLEALRDDALI